MKRSIRMAAFGITMAALLAACGAGESERDAGDPAPAQVSDAASSADSEPGADARADTEDGSVAGSAGSPPEFVTVTAMDMELSWRVVGPDLEVKVSAPTTGWVAVGFDPSRMMRDANILIGYVSGTATVVTDQFGASTVTHRPDTDLGGTEDITVLGGTEAAGRTELHFTIPLDSGDDRDRPLVPGQEYRVILAYGENGADDLESYHKGRTGLTITL